jgi:hypothetical protein
MGARKQGAQGEAAAGDALRAPLPLTASLVVDAERVARMWAMSGEQRVTAARQGLFSLGEMLRWAARAPHEVPRLNGEWFFIAEKLADVADYGEERRARGEQVL